MPYTEFIKKLATGFYSALKFVAMSLAFLLYLVGIVGLWAAGAMVVVGASAVAAGFFITLFGLLPFIFLALLLILSANSNTDTTTNTTMPTRDVSSGFMHSIAFFTPYIWMGMHVALLGFIGIALGCAIGLMIWSGLFLIEKAFGQEASVENRGVFVKSMLIKLISCLGIAPWYTEVYGLAAGPNNRVNSVPFILSTAKSNIDLLNEIDEVKQRSKSTLLSAEEEKQAEDISRKSPDLKILSGKKFEKAYDEYREYKKDGKCPLTLVEYSELGDPVTLVLNNKAITYECMALKEYIQSKNDTLTTDPLTRETWNTANPPVAFYHGFHPVTNDIREKIQDFSNKTKDNESLVGNANTFFSKEKKTSGNESREGSANLNKKKFCAIS